MILILITNIGDIYRLQICIYREIVKLEYINTKLLETCVCKWRRWLVSFFAIRKNISNILSKLVGITYLTPPELSGSLKWTCWPWSDWNLPTKRHSQQPSTKNYPNDPIIYMIICQCTNMYHYATNSALEERRLHDNPT